MPDTAKKDLKTFYSIGEVAEMFNVNPTLLRFWEKQFPQIVPKKAGRNVRQYTTKEIERIRIIYNLVKVRGMKLDAAAALIRKNNEGVARETELAGELRDIRAELLSLKRSLSQLE